MTVILALAIWVAVSAICAPAIGQLLFVLNNAYATAHTVQVSPGVQRARGYARRKTINGSWERRPIAQSKFG